MPRELHHTAYARRPYAEICDEVAADPKGVIAAAADAAVRHANQLVANVDAAMAFFAPLDEVDIDVQSLRRKGNHHSWLYFTWTADPDRRLLPNVDAQLDLVPLVPAGPEALTVLSIHGHYMPPPSMFASMEEAVLGRRIVDAAMHRFLNHLADSLAAAGAD